MQLWNVEHKFSSIASLAGLIRNAYKDLSQYEVILCTLSLVVRDLLDQILFVD